MLLLAAAVAPSIALMYYFYMRDKYEREPRRMLIKAFIAGMIIILPVLIVEVYLNIFDMPTRNFFKIGYTAFIVAGLVEETFKYLAFVLYIWKDREFNEAYDAIVYCVFISLGFATIENIAYVLATGFNTALLRSLTAVPAHALFAVSMGYYLGIAKFSKQPKRQYYMKLGLFVPVVLHGIYDFILFSKRTYLLVLFIPYMLYLWRRGLKNVDELIETSPYKENDSK